jgi:Response regulators consisting of a CheY-like receiver domain and a winged-helix DNA-binding domain
MEFKKVLLVEDDDSFRIIIKDTLELTSKYEVFDAKNGSEGYKAFKSFKPDVIVTDVDMPVMSGFEMIEKIRKEDPDIPVIITTGMTEAKDIGRGYNLEIDTYIKKPFSPLEVNLALEALFRRVEKSRKPLKEKNNLHALGIYNFDIENNCLICENNKIKLTKRDTQILQLLYENKGNVVLRKDILVLLWGEDNYFNSRSLDVFIRKLRNHLKEDKSIELVTIRQEGLKLIIS